MYAKQKTRWKEPISKKNERQTKRGRNKNHKLRARRGRHSTMLSFGLSVLATVNSKVNGGKAKPFFPLLHRSLLSTSRLVQCARYTRWLTNRIIKEIKWQTSFICWLSMNENSCHFFSHPKNEDDERFGSFFFISEVPRKTVTNWIRRVKLNLWFTLYVGGVTFTHWIKPSHSFDDKTIRLYGFSKSARRIVREENRKKNRKAFDTIFCHSQMLETRWSHRRYHICTHWKTFLWMKSRE